MLTEGTDSVATRLRVLAEPDNRPAVFHCSVGKDRTGVLSAVVLGMLGVPDEVIVEDYALSRLAMVHILERLRQDYPDARELVERYAPVILAVEPAAMAGFIAAVRSEYGSFEALADALGVASEVSAAGRADVLEPGVEPPERLQGRPAPDQVAAPDGLDLDVFAGFGGGHDVTASHVHAHVEDVARPVSPEQQVTGLEG